MPKVGTIRGIGWQNFEHLPGFWGMRRSSEMKNKADFEQILEMKMPFNGQKGRKIEAFWQLGRVEMRAIPFGGLKPSFPAAQPISTTPEIRGNESNPLRGIETQEVDEGGHHRGDHPEWK